MFAFIIIVVLAAAAFLWRALSAQGKKMAMAELHLSDEEFESKLQQARIVPGYQAGNFYTFIIAVDLDADRLKHYLESALLVERMLQVVELRIREDQDYEEELSDLDNMSRESSGWTPNLLATRIVLPKLSQVPACSWEISIDADGRDRIELKKYC